MRLAVLAGLVLLAGCIHPQAAIPTTAPPGPVPAKPWRIFVYRHCTIPSAPAFPDTDAALEAAPGLLERVARLRAGRDARIAYETRVADAVHACR